MKKEKTGQIWLDYLIWAVQIFKPRKLLYFQASEKENRDKSFLLLNLIYISYVQTMWFIFFMFYYMIYSYYLILSKLGWYKLQEFDFCLWKSDIEHWKKDMDNKMEFNCSRLEATHKYKEGRR